MGTEQIERMTKAQALAHQAADLKRWSPGRPWLSSAVAYRTAADLLSDDKWYDLPEIKMLVPFGDDIEYMIQNHGKGPSEVLYSQCTDHMEPDWGKCESLMIRPLRQVTVIDTRSSAMWLGESNWVDVSGTDEPVTCWEVCGRVSEGIRLTGDDVMPITRVSTQKIAAEIQRLLQPRMEREHQVRIALRLEGEQLQEGRDEVHDLAPDEDQEEKRGQGR
jgi:hypothetical protein